LFEQVSDKPTDESGDYDNNDVGSYTHELIEMADVGSRLSYSV
jgi:hypothetical protein